MALFPAIAPNIAVIRGTKSDRRGNISFEQEGAYLGAMEMSLAAHNNGGKVIAQVRKIVENGSLKPHDVHVPGIFVDAIVETPDMLQTTATPYDPAISGEVARPLEDFSLPEFGIAKVLARRVAKELRKGWTVNIGFGISANVPRIFIEEGLHGDVTWVIEQGAVGGVPLLDFKFGCSANAKRSSRRRTSSRISSPERSTLRCFHFLNWTRPVPSTFRGLRPYRIGRPAQADS